MSRAKQNISQADDGFQTLRDNISSLDPVYWCEKHLNIDGKPFTLSGHGFKPFSDIYRYIGIKGLERSAKPIILVKGRQVGGTVMLGALECYFGASGLFGRHNKPPIRVLHCFPDQNKSLTYSKTKLTSLISSSSDDNNKKQNNEEKLTFIQRKIDKSAATNDSANFKRFENDNQIFIEYIGLDGDRLRSRTVDVLFYDEVQDMRQNAILAVNKCASQAQYGQLLGGVKAYIGTPKQKGSNYWKMWESSSQQYFHLGCEACGKHFPLYTPGTDDWEEIWISGFMVKCRHCGHEQDKRQAADRGKWVASNKTDTVPMFGYHVNQLLYPTFTKEAILAEKNNPLTTEKMFRNEVLGEFFAGDASPLTIDNIDDFAADRDRSMSLNGSEFGDKNVFLGCDWGRKYDMSQFGDSEKNQIDSKAGKSYSCAVALVPNGVNLDIVYATRFKKNTLEYRTSLVQEIYRQFMITLAVGDIGDGHEVTEALQSEFQDRFLASMAAGNLTNGKAIYKGDYSPHTIVFDRNYYIEELIDLIKKGRIRFPYKSYDRISWLVEHCTSMEIKPVKKGTGEIVANYIKGSTPNDGFMALLNAYLAYKFHLTKGFTIKDPKKLIGMEGKKKEDVPAVLAYAPRGRQNR